MLAAYASKKLRRNNDRPFTVIVEGNIGSGKTTFLNHFQKYNNVCVLSEPINKWRDCDGHNLFGLMYQDPQKWAFSFQSYVQLTMLENHTNEIDKPIKLMERSIYSARYCFVEKMLKDGLMPAASGAVINEWFKWCTKHTMCAVDLIVYLRTTPEVAYERIMSRNRSEEKTISMDYLKDLHKAHEEWLYYKTSHTCPATVLTLNADMDKSTIIEEYTRSEPEAMSQLGVLQSPA